MNEIEIGFKDQIGAKDNARKINHLKFILYSECLSFNKANLLMR